MVKLSLWTGAPLLITYFASLYTVVVENILLFFLLSLLALMVAICPRIAGERAKE